jgi:hypothetical protein
VGAILITIFAIIGVGSILLILMWKRKFN